MARKVILKGHTDLSQRKLERVAEKHLAALLRHGRKITQKRAADDLESLVLERVSAQRNIIDGGGYICAACLHAPIQEYSGLCDACFAQYPYKVRAVVKPVVPETPEIPHEKINELKTKKYRRMIDLEGGGDGKENTETKVNK